MFGIGETLGKIFGTDKAIESVIDNVSSGIGKLIYTDEEKADDKAKSVTEARAMIIEWMRTTSGQNLARRLIALIVTGVWVLQYVGAMVLSITAVWVPDPKPFQESARIMGGYAEQMNGAMMLILGFYFAAPHMGKLVEYAMTKFSGKPRSEPS